ncbi:MAG: beta-lactamase family protein [Bryobacteraceae bacterium]|nr:beta-lactamase family protein [Bryobacteraceae bacterium]
MAISRSRWLALILVPAGLLLVGIPALFLFNAATAPRYHPNPAEVPSDASGPPPPKWSSATGEARQVVRAALSEQNLPGLSVAVGSGGNIVWAEGFGWADLEKKTAIAPETRFRIGTASVALTSVAAGLLIEQGRLKLDDAVQNHIPGFPDKEWPVTFRHLMSHTSGIRNDGGDEGALLSRHCARPVEGFDAFAGQKLLFEPGTRYRFSVYNWILMSAFLESASGQPFLTLMKKQVFEPLGMEDTVPHSTTVPVPDLATSYFPRFAADPKYGLHLLRDVDYSCYAGASAFLSTPSDLVRFLIAVNQGKLLRPATLELLQTPQRLASGEETGYGLGWELETVTLAGRPARMAGHDGDVLGGNVVSLMWFPQHRLAVAVVSNISYADTHAVALNIAGAFVKRPAAR